MNQGFKQGQLSLVGLFLLACATPCGAANLLKDFEMNPRADGSAVLSLSFTQPVAKQNVSIQKERGFVQLKIRDISLSKAQIKEFEASHIKKIFVYPFAKDETRLRAFLRVPESLDGESVQIKQAGPDRIEVSLRQKSDAVPLPVIASGKTKKASLTHESMSAVLKGRNLDQIEEKILADVLAAGPAGVENGEPAPSSADATTIAKNAINEEASAKKLSPAVEVTPAQRKAALTDNATLKPLSAVTTAVDRELRTASVASLTLSSTTANQPIGVKNEPSKGVARVALALILVLGVMIGFLMLLKRYGSKLNLSKLPFGKSERLIQVIATHRLGRNQAISLVKVTGEFMVLGISGENINLLTSLGKELDVEKGLEDRFWGGTFEKFLNTYSKPEQAAKAPSPAPSSSEDRDRATSTLSAQSSISSLDFRDKIRSRLGSLKALNQ